MIDLIREVAIVAVVYALSIFFERYIPIPASLVSMGILFFLLYKNILKLKHFSKVVPLALTHLSLFFIPPAVKILDSTEALKGSIGRIVLLLVISNIVVMGVTGAVVQAVIRGEER